jgi:hypothetical protein
MARWSCASAVICRERCARFENENLTPIYTDCTDQEREQPRIGAKETRI